MGFLSGVITGVAVAAGAAAWYMSRSGSKVREQYQVEKRLGEIGDQMEARTRDIQAQVNAQISEMRSKADGNGHDAAAADTLDAATASAAEAAADVAADVESTAGKAKKAAKDVADEAAS
jgi:hypothetical protein